MLADKHANNISGEFLSFSSHITHHENPDLFHALHHRLQDEYSPKGASEAHLVWALAFAIWRAERAARLERSIFEDMTPSAAIIDACTRYADSQQRAVCQLLDRLSRRHSAGIACLRMRPACLGTPANDTGSEDDHAAVEDPSTVTAG